MDVAAGGFFFAGAAASALPEQASAAASIVPWSMVRIPFVMVTAWHTHLNGTPTACQGFGAPTQHGVESRSVQLLLVDDSLEVLDLVDRALTRDGHQVRVAASVAEARLQLAGGPPDVMVLDVALPDGNGVELCRALRSEGAKFPILLLTAHGDVPRRVAGLDAGADDFLAKPFAVAELRARVRALGRRGPIERPASIGLGAAQLDLTARRATCGDREVPITAREWAVIELLVARHGRVVERTVILESIWGEVTASSSSSLDVIIGRIRRKLGPDAVRTVRGEGYAADVR